VRGVAKNPELYARDAEREALLGNLDGASEGLGRTVLVEGPPGIGKTSILDLAAALASTRGFLVLRGRGGEHERGIPFGLVRQLLEAEVRSRPDSESGRVFSGAARLARPALFPELQGEAPADVFSTLHGLYWLTANLAEERPLLLAVDDAHWADPGSLRFLEYLTRRLAGLRACAAIATRSGPEGALPELETIRGEPSTSRLMLAPLDETAVGSLIAERTGEAPTRDFVRACHERTGGNPFYLEELIEATVDSRGATADEEGVLGVVPEHVQRSVNRRLDDLGSEAKTIARALAVLGTEVPGHRVAALSGLDIASVERTADRLVEFHILRSRRPLDFQHPLLRAAVYSEIPPGERSLAHSRAAAILADEGRPRAEAAAQLLLTEPASEPDRVEALMAGAAEALSQGAPDTAIPFLERALREPAGARRSEVLARLGTAENLLGREAAIGHLQEALEAEEDATRSASIALELLRALHTWRGRDAAQILAPHMSRLDPDDALWVDAEAVFTAGSEFRDVAAPIQRLATHFRSRGDTPGERAALLMGAALASTSREAEAYAVRAFREGQLIEDAGAAMLSFTFCWIAVITDRLDLADRTLARTQELAEERASTPGLGLTTLWRAIVAHRRGELEAAAEHASAGLDLNVRVGTHFGISWQLAALIAALVDMGRFEEADDALDRTAGALRGSHTSGLLPLLTQRARLRLAQGRPEEALADAERLAELAGTGPKVAAWTPHLELAALAQAQLGENESAERTASQALEDARAWGTNRAVGVGMRVMAAVSPRDDRVSLLEGAVNHLTRSSGALELARARVDLGAELRRRGERVAAREHLEEGLRGASACAARPLAERAETELRAAGSRPRNVLRSGTDALTPSERRVARMAAEGLSNPEIAQALYVTRKTVEKHLGNVYMKLDIGSRDELPVALAAPHQD
jgi:DNA-binding CsgD family transcriptional regulator